MIVAHDQNFPVVNQILTAKSHHERARILLQLSDVVLLAEHSALERACTVVKFPAGKEFIVWRINALCRTRDVHGLLPQTIASELEAWRKVLSRYSAGGPLPGERDGQ